MTPAPRTAQEQRDLDYRMYAAFRNNKPAEFKQALAEGANPDAHYEDGHTDSAYRTVSGNPTVNCCRGEHLLAQMVVGRPAGDHSPAR